MLPVVFITTDEKITVETLFKELGFGDKMNKFNEALNNTAHMRSIKESTPIGFTCYNEFVCSLAVGRESKRLSKLVFNDIVINRANQ